MTKKQRTGRPHSLVGPGKGLNKETIKPASSVQGEEKGSCSPKSRRETPECFCNDIYRRLLSLLSPSLSHAPHACIPAVSVSTCAPPAPALSIVACAYLPSLLSSMFLVSYIFVSFHFVRFLDSWGFPCRLTFQFSFQPSSLVCAGPRAVAEPVLACRWFASPSARVSPSTRLLLVLIWTFCLG